MKTKNLTIVFVAVILAAGSAFATKKYSVANNVRIWWKQTSTSTFVCTTVPLECENQFDGSLCIVSIVRSDGMSELVYAHGNVICTTQLRHNHSPYAGVYDAGVGSRPYDVADDN